MTVRYTGQAILDLEDGADYYALRGEELAADFLAAVNTAISEAAQHPRRFPVLDALADPHGVRRNLLQRFPYYIAYRVVGGAIEIVAVAHTSPEPGYWTEEK